MRLVRYLYVTNFFTGAVVMIIELLGTRFLAPYFGSSVYTWTALITVTLVSLAVGYRAGGALADRFPKAELLYGLIFGAGAFLLFLLLIRNAILRGCLSGGIVAGTLTSATVLFGPPLLILGTVAPFSVKLCAREMSSLGSVVGRLYALSTVGSFVGTVSAGFLLLPYFSTTSILTFCAGLLGVLALLFFVFFARALPGQAASAIVILTSVLTGLPSSQLPAGTLTLYGWQWKTVYQTNSFYGRIRVIDTRFEKGSPWQRRFLLNDGLIQGSYSLSTRKPSAPFPYALADLVLAGKPPIRRALVLGLGAGFVPRILQHHMSEQGTLQRIVTVEINPTMYEAAVRFFDFPRDAAWQSSCPVVFEDARTFVRNCRERFDAIVVDTFLGDNAPTHLLSYEMFSQLRRILAPKGRVSVNIFASLRGPGARLLAALVRTLREGPGASGPFPFVQLFCEEATAIPHNVYVLAAADPSARHPQELVVVKPPEEIYHEVQAAMRDRTEDLAGVQNAPILTDDYNPAEHLDITVRLRIRENVRMYWGESLTE